MRTLTHRPVGSGRHRTLGRIYRTTFAAANGTRNSRSWPNGRAGRADAALALGPRESNGQGLYNHPGA